jgi:hypothetical protein
VPALTGSLLGGCSLVSCVKTGLMRGIILDIRNEQATLWCMDGAKSLSSLGLGQVVAEAE